MDRSPRILASAFSSLLLCASSLRAAAAKPAGGAKVVSSASARDSAYPPLSGAEEVNAVMDDWHDAAAKADEIRFFKSFAPGAVVLGVDSGDRWPLERFRRYAHARFVKKEGWANVPRARRVSFSPDGKTAWFDEDLENLRWGSCRGTGVLVRYRGGWRIAQYHFSVSVPTALLPKVVELIKGPPAAAPAPAAGPKQP